MAGFFGKGAQQGAMGYMPGYTYPGQSGLPQFPARQDGTFAPMPAPDPYEGQRPERQEPPQRPQEGKSGFFGKLGKAAGVIGDIAMFGPFAGMVRNDRTRSEEDRQVNNRYREAMTQKAMRDEDRQQVVNLGDGGVATWSPQGGLTTVREPQPAKHVDPVIARLEAAGIDINSPLGQSLIKQSIPGYGYSGEVFQHKQELKQATPGKARSNTYRAPHYEYRTNPTTGQVERRRIG